MLFQLPGGLLGHQIAQACGWESRWVGGCEEWESGRRPAHTHPSVAPAQFHVVSWPIDGDPWLPYWPKTSSSISVPPPRIFSWVLHITCPYSALLAGRAGTRPFRPCQRLRHAGPNLRQSRIFPHALCRMRWHPSSPTAPTAAACSTMLPRRRRRWARGRWRMTWRRWWRRTRGGTWTRARCWW